jgi:hypothetical protein
LQGCDKHPQLAFVIGIQEAESVAARERASISPLASAAGANYP